MKAATAARRVSLAALKHLPPVRTTAAAAAAAYSPVKLTRKGQESGQKLYKAENLPETSVHCLKQNVS